MHRSIVWFRKGLRLHDNPAMTHAIKDASVLFPIFVLDPWFVSSGRVGPNRLKFLYECLIDLDEQLQQQFSSRLIVLHGNPVDVIPNIIEEWNVSKICWERDTEPYAMDRDEALIRGIHSKHHHRPVEMFVPTSHTLFNPDAVIAANGGQAPKTYQAFQTCVAKAFPHGPRKAEAAPSKLPPLEEDVYNKAHKGLDMLKRAFENDPTAKAKLKGGEREALRIMRLWMDEKTRNVWTFAKPDTAPTDFGPASTTQLSPYLKFGCLSACTFYEALKAAEAKAPKGTKVTLPPVSLCGQLLWREFFYTVAWDKSPGYDHMQTNEICLQIPWNYDQTLIRAWSEGKTGYPWIDAAMKQLITEGWMHHLARHSVACFLTRGDLFCGWEAGVEVFDRLLLDADWALNNGNWLWLSSSAFFHQYFRVYSPIAFPKKTDPDGKFVRHFLPQLANFPAKYIYEPWKAPMDVQRRAGCIVGTDYPAPIVDHDTISKTNLAVMKAAYQNGAMGQRIPAVPSFRSRWVPLQHLLNHSQGAEKQALSSTSDAETEGPVAKKRRL